jgi:hypothetical protein
MSTPATNPLSFNAYVQQIGVLAVELTVETDGVYAFVNAGPNTILPQMLNYAELRIQRDLDLLASQSSNTYTLSAGTPILSIPVNDFFSVQTLELVQTNGTQVYTSNPLLPVSKEFIQNCYGGLTSSGIPQYWAPYGDNFGDGQDSYYNVLFGPPPNYAYTVRVTGTSRSPSLYQYAATGIADTSYTYISTYYPDMLILASMIYITMFQRNFSAVSDSPEMGQTYEKQYQAARLMAIPDENKRKLQGSAWSAYSTPVSATQTR